MTRSFPAGVTDGEGRRGFIGVNAADVTAVDLDTGSVLWTRRDIGRPLAATATRLITIETSGEELALRMTDAESGRDVTRITNLGLPLWARESAEQPDMLQ